MARIVSGGLEELYGLELRVRPDGLTKQHTYVAVTEYVTLHLLINAVGNTAGESDRLDLRLGGEGVAAVGIESGVVDVRLLEVEGLRQLVRHQITDLAELLLLCRVPTLS